MKHTQSAADILFDIFIYVFFTAFTLICVFPMYYILINTISDNSLVATGRILLLPKGIHFQNYVKIMKLNALPQAVFISVSRTLLGTFLSTLCTAYVAYILTKRVLWHRKLIYRFLLLRCTLTPGLSRPTLTCAFFTWTTPTGFTLSAW